MLRRTGGLNRQKRGCGLPEVYTHTRTNTHTHTPFSLSWPLLLLYVWHAVCFKARTTRHNTVCLGNSLPLHHSLLLCTSLSLPRFSALTLFPNSDSTETLKELSLAQPCHKSDALSLSFPPVANEQRRRQRHAQK